MKWLINENPTHCCECKVLISDVILIDKEGREKHLCSRCALANHNEMVVSPLDGEPLDEEQRL